MPEVVYAIVFKGEVLPEFQVVSVKAHLAKMLRADAAMMAKLFAGNAVVLKRTKDKAEAMKYGQALKKVGANVSIRAIKGDAKTAAPAPAAKAAAPAAKPNPFLTPEAPPPPAKPNPFLTAEDQPPAKPNPFLSAEDQPVAAKPNPFLTNEAPAKPNPFLATDNGPARKAPFLATPEEREADATFSLRENSGNLFEPAPEVERVVVDVSNIETIENWDEPLAPPKEVTAVQVDISGLAISEPDDTPLGIPTPEVPRVEAPDFGLDEPGAMLDTIKVEVEPVNPDTSSLSLAAAGSDLLEDEEKDHKPVPPPPDVSSISLAPNV